MSKKMSNRPFGFSSKKHEQKDEQPSIRVFERKSGNHPFRFIYNRFLRKNQNISDHVSGTNTNLSSAISTVPVTLVVGSPYPFGPISSTMRLPFSTPTTL